MSSLKKYIPNALSLSRIIVFPPIFFYICYLLPLGHISFLFVGLLAGYTDWLDGHYARKWKLISEFGKFIDPVGDKICIAFIVLSLLMRNVLPLWFGGLILFRDIMMILLSILMILKKREFKAIQSRISGKATFAVISITVLAYYFSLLSIILFFTVLTVFVVLWSMVDYSKIFFLRIKNSQA
jgi:CDP-diacylglycerol--glycerol-3-phosphate 3-phosphatidyltransferase